MTDIERATSGVEHQWPASTDTLCCGTLGSIEFLWEAADALDREDLRRLATRQLLTVVDAAGAAGDYRWSSGTVIQPRPFPWPRRNRVHDDAGSAPGPAQLADLGVGGDAGPDRPSPTSGAVCRCSARCAARSPYRSCSASSWRPAVVSSAGFGPVLQAIADAGMAGNLAGAWDAKGALLSRADGATSGPLAWLGAPLPLRRCWASGRRRCGRPGTGISAVLDRRPGRTGLLTVIRSRVHDHIQTLSLDFFTGARVGALMQRVQWRRQAFSGCSPCASSRPQSMWW